MEIVSVREFARRIGVSLTAIQKGIANGRIKAIKNDDGKSTGIDWDTQASAWEDNCKDPQKRAHNQAGGRPRNDGQPTAPVSTGSARNQPQTPPSGGRNDDQSPDGGMTLAQIQRARELVKLQIDNEKLKEVRGESVSAAQVRHDGAKLAATVISGLYNIPERCSDDLAGMSSPHEIHKLLTREIDEVVAELRKQYGQQ